ncbi:uncharacterized protein F4812DRAFT_464922 [Daldinia caldariorum]|uniref:uncharacterized protein n=1 Tax=Daldinia caldariorum TaxID=326644 RepID=UPI0020078168|nr:uncharacterized protein F4812DRAFT_464922 [Daldinia caldariorum]KAI1472945.1 hypothetical protein F4812DRAFT_464922 [Daldinia caldariorum]
MRRHREAGIRRGHRGPNIALQTETGQEPRYRKHLTRRTLVRSASCFSRFINRYDSHEILILVDGNCINNGSKDEMARPSGGCSFTFKGPGRYGSEVELPFKDDIYHDGGMIGFPLEESGPGGESYNATSNRAKLRAVIAALEFRVWQDEGWRRIVIATDLKYVADGATIYLRNGFGAVGEIADSRA